MSDRRQSFGRRISNDDRIKSHLRTTGIGKGRKHSAPRDTVRKRKEGGGYHTTEFDKAVQSEPAYMRHTASSVLKHPYETFSKDKAEARSLGRSAPNSFRDVAKTTRSAQLRAAQVQTRVAAQERMKRLYEQKRARLQSERRNMSGRLTGKGRRPTYMLPTGTAAVHKHNGTVNTSFAKSPVRPVVPKFSAYQRAKRRLSTDYVGTENRASYARDRAIVSPSRQARRQSVELNRAAHEAKGRPSLPAQQRFYSFSRPAEDGYAAADPQLYQAPRRPKARESGDFVDKEVKRQVSSGESVDYFKAERDAREAHRAQVVAMERTIVEAEREQENREARAPEHWIEPPEQWARGYHSTRAAQ